MRGRGAKGKTIVFGIYDRRRENIYTRVIKQVDSKTTLKIIKSVAAYSSTIYTDGFRFYIPLKGNGYMYHETIEHGGTNLQGTKPMSMALKISGRLPNQYDETQGI